MSEELIKRLRGIALSKENTDFSYGRKAPLYGKETEIEWEAAARIEELEHKLRTTYLEALAISDTNNEMAARVRKLEADRDGAIVKFLKQEDRAEASEARLSEAVKVLEELVTATDSLGWAANSSLADESLNKAKAFLATLGEEK